jgi:hypothetical protein
LQIQNPFSSQEMISAYFKFGFACWVRVGSNRFLVEEETGNVLGFKPHGYDVRLEVTDPIPRLNFTMNGVAVRAIAQGVEGRRMTANVSFAIEVPADKAVTILAPGGGVFCILSLEVGPEKVVMAVPNITNVQDVVQNLGGDFGGLQGLEQIPARLLVNPADLFVSVPETPITLSPVPASPPDFELDRKRKRAGPETRASKKLKQI